MKNSHIYELAKAALSENSYDEAISLFCECIGENPVERSYFWHLGLCYLLLGNNEEAQNTWFVPLFNATEEEQEIWGQELIIILANFALKFLEKRDYKSVKKIIDVLEELDSKSENYLFLYEKIQDVISQLTNEAVVKSLGMKFEEAKAIYNQLLELSPDNSEAWHNLGMTNYELARLQLESSRFCLLKALQLDDSVSTYHYSFALIHEAMGDFSLAKQAYHEAIRLKPDDVDAYNNLGTLEKKTNNLIEAEQVFKQFIKINPMHFGTYLNLGNLYFDQANYQQAIEIYEEGLRVKPRDPMILENLALANEKIGNMAESLSCYGFAFYRKNQYQEAINYFNQYLEHEAGSAILYVSLADCYKKLNLRDKAIEIYEQGINHNSQDERLYRCLFYCYQESGLTNKSIELVRQASYLFPESFSFQRLEQSILPIVYQTKDEIDQSRQRFINSLYDFRKQILLSLQAEQSNLEKNKVAALESISLRTNFYSNYQKMNDLVIQKIYGELVHMVMKTNFPEYSEERLHTIGTNRENKKIKIGYVSSKMQGLIGKMLLGWIKNAKSCFDIYCYDTSSQLNAINPELQIYSHSYSHFPDHLPNQLRDICEQIWNDKLDILVFFDIGLKPLMTQLAGLRFALIQCATWGHPITSGSPTIDYFLSSESVESPQGEDHYSEQLVRLPKLGITYPMPDLALTTANKGRDSFDLDRDDVVYLCCQHIPKYLPQYDYLFPIIAQQVSQARIVFIEGTEGSNTYQQFQQRLKGAFDQLEVDFEKHCLFLPHLSTIDYFNVLKFSDIFLDTIGWSGGITSLDAIACDLPIVTLPGEFFRGRQSYGMLNIIGVTETIAHSEEQYIEIAVRLGLDNALRNAVRTQISQTKQLLYNDISCVSALENFYLSAIDHYLQESLENHQD
jgi:predicted O-linked N-acetylglucosamine transferase (SPINDLY family)